MGTDTDQTSEVQETSSAPAPETPAIESSPSSEGVELASKEEVSKTEPVVAAYKPDYKLKVYDEEKELDDPLLKSLIKDADTEKKVKEIAQKYLGFDTVKARLEKTRGDLSEYQKSTQPIVDLYNNYSKVAQKGDLDGIFQLLQIPDEMIFKWAVQKAEQTPEQRAYQEQQRRVEFEREQLQSQNQTLMTQQQQQLSEFRAQELNWVLARPEVSSVATAFDQKVGRPGAFRQAVIEKGLAHYTATQGREDLSAEQAAHEVLKLIGAVVTPMTSPGANQASQAGLIQQNGQPPIIPNVSAKASSPVKKQVRSISDLKKKREELMGSSS